MSTEKTKSKYVYRPPFRKYLKQPPSFTVKVGNYVDTKCLVINSDQDSDENNRNFVRAGGMGKASFLEGFWASLGSQYISGEYFQLSDMLFPHYKILKLFSALLAIQMILPKNGYKLYFLQNIFYWVCVVTVPKNRRRREISKSQKWYGAAQIKPYVITIIDYYIIYISQQKV